MAKLYLPRAYW